MKHTSLPRPIRTGLALVVGVAATSFVSGGQAQQFEIPRNIDNQPDAQMRAVLNTYAALDPKPIPKLTPKQARQQPLPGDAVKALLRAQGKSTAPEPVASVKDYRVPTPEGDVTVRVYKPRGVSGDNLPVIVYFHGGGFVIASVSAYDASARALANATGAIVAAVAYPQAPENRLPQPHEASYAATQWIMDNASKWGGDEDRVAVAGESAGGNLAIDMSLMAVQRGGEVPIYQVLVYPVAQYGDFNTQSYRENANAKPLNRPLMKWFFKYAAPPKSVIPNPRTNPLVSPLRADASLLAKMPPTTIVLAEIDPLRTEGAMLGYRLSRAGVPVRMKVYPGVTHEFFGMGAVVDKAKDAVNFAATGLKSAFRNAD